MRRLTSRFMLSALAVLILSAPALAGDVFLGITMDDISPSMARALQIDEGRGVLVNDIVDDSAADEAGLEAGDVIMKIGDRNINGSKGLSKVLHSYDPGDEVLVTVMRSGVLKVFKVTLGEREKRGVFVMGDGEGKTWSFNGPGDVSKYFQWSDGDSSRKIVIDDMSWAFGDDRGFLGIVPQDLDEDELEEMGVPGGEGVVIHELFDDSGAAEAGLEEGDVIVAIDDEDIADGDDLSDVMEDTEVGQEVEVRVIRDGKMREYDVVLGETSFAGIGDHIKMFMPRDPHNPKQPRFYEFHSGNVPHVLELERLKEEQADMEELKDDLTELKEELKKLREELQKKR